MSRTAAFVLLIQMVLCAQQQAAVKEEEDDSWVNQLRKDHTPLPQTDGEKTDLERQNPFPKSDFYFEKIGNAKKMMNSISKKYFKNVAITITSESHSAEEGSKCENFVTLVVEFMPVRPGAEGDLPRRVVGAQQIKYIGYNYSLKQQGHLYSFHIRVFENEACIPENMTGESDAGDHEEYLEVKNEKIYQELHSLSTAGTIGADIKMVYLDKVETIRLGSRKLKSNTMWNVLNVNMFYLNVEAWTTRAKKESKSFWIWMPVGKV